MDVAVFQICSFANSGKRLKLPIGSFSIGRAPTCNLRIPSDDVSRLHCEFRVDSNGVVVRDLRSRNGTFLNGRRLEVDAILAPGDRVRVGKLELQLVNSQDETELPSFSPSQQSAVDPNRMTLDELVQFDDDPVELESEHSTDTSSSSDLTVGNFGTTIIGPGQLNQDVSSSAAGKKPAEQVDNTQLAAKVALRKIFRGKS